MMTRRILAAAVVALAFISGGRPLSGERLSTGQRATSVVSHGPHGADVADGADGADGAMLARAGFASEDTAQAVLTAALRLRHPAWVDVPAGSATIRAFVVYPQRPDAAPVVLVTANNQGLSDWLRAVGDQVAAEGFIAIVPDVLSGVGPDGGGSEAFANREAAAGALALLTEAEMERRIDAVRTYAGTIPGSNGHTATLAFDFAASQGRLDAVIDAPSAETHVASFELTEHAWHHTLDFLTRHAEGAVSVAQASAQEPGRGDRAERGGCTGSMREKCDALPANFLMAATTVAHSPRKGEWIDIPMGATKIRTWIAYPQGAAKVPVAVVIHPGPGMDMGEPPTLGGGANWMRAIADQLAAEGFLALVPDFTSGLGPGGGNFDSFKYPDEVGRAMGRRTRAEQIDLMRAVHAYGLRLPQSNGKSATIGFCFGGGMSWIAAAELAGLNAAVVFYGNAPNEATMTRIAAPVAAFFGGNDLGLAPEIAPATATMKRLGKSFDVHVYERATHVFLYRQDLGENFAATQDAWPKAMAFLKQHAK
jgi:carboxymethylenebutenolidase